MLLRRCGSTVLFGLAFFLVAATAAHAQRTTGDISGTVTDATNALLPVQP